MRRVEQCDNMPIFAWSENSSCNASTKETDNTVHLQRVKVRIMAYRCSKINQLESL